MSAISDEEKNRIRASLRSKGWILTTRTTWKKYLQEYIFRTNRCNRKSRVREYIRIKKEVGLPKGFHMIPDWYIPAGC